MQIQADGLSTRSGDGPIPRRKQEFMNQSDEPTATSRQLHLPWWHRVWEPCDIASVVFFRVVFAGAMLWHVGLVMKTGWVAHYFANRPYHLKYYGFEWVEALGGTGMWWIHLLMGLAAVGVGLGLMYRVSAVVLFVTFTYTFLSEAALYQNHYYLVALIAFVLILIPAHGFFSVDAIVMRRCSTPFVPSWCRWVLMFLIALPYTYGGIAKLNADWLQAMPLLIWLPSKTHIPIVGPFMGEPWVAWMLSYAGLVFDLLIVPLLLWRKSRLVAYVAAVMFHLMNSVLFTIDIFPWMMILVTTIFFAPDWPRRLLRRPQPMASEKATVTSDTPRPIQRAALAVAGIFVMWQLTFPLRHFAYPGNPSWTEEGQNFAWRMMMHHKDLFIRFYATDGLTGRTVQVPAGQMLTRRQLTIIAMSPEQIAAVSRFFAEGALRVGVRQVQIRAVAIISLNGRKPQLVFDPDLDLLTVERTWQHQPWIYPLEEPLRAEHWDVPSKEWPNVLGLTLPNASIPRRRPMIRNFDGTPGP